jgi:hypothetical protein
MEPWAGSYLTKTQRICVLSGKQPKDSDPVRVPLRFLTWTSIYWVFPTQTAAG